MWGRRKTENKKRRDVCITPCEDFFIGGLLGVRRDGDITPYGFVDLILIVYYTSLSYRMYMLIGLKFKLSQNAFPASFPARTSMSIVSVLRDSRSLMRNCLP